MSNLISSLEIRQYYDEIQRHPAFAAELSRYQLEKVKQYAEGEKYNVFKSAATLFESNPNYWYGPIESITGNELESFVHKQPDYQDAVQVIKTIDKIINPTPKPIQTYAQKTAKVKPAQIALIHIYEGKEISKEKADAIAAEHGYTAKTSGHGLYQDYTTYLNRVDRIGHPGSKTKLKNKINLFESILESLSKKAKESAMSDINSLRALYEAENK